MMRRCFGFVRRYLAVSAVGLTFLWSAIAIALYRRAEAPPGSTVLRIGHWQLEASVRDAIDHMAAEYRRTVNPNVYIVQDAIPEGVYGQWLTTQLLGGTAPDMLEMGLGAPYHLLVQYYNRYFVPLTPYIDRPNPHNRGSVLEGVPLRSTFKDGMRTSYIEELQEYMNIPLSQFGVRVFYNKDLLKQLTGRDEAPGDYRTFLAVCERIAACTAPDGKPYVPIASSRYHFTMWESMLFDPLTYNVREVADFNRDGFVSVTELYAAFKTGRLTFEHPAIAARFRMMREVTSYFQTGYTGLTRDEAVFLYAQSRAVFISSGTWDAASLVRQAEGKFEAGIMDFPRPAPDDPVYGDVVAGPAYERPQGGFPFGITRSCEHPDIALDFMLFMASRDRNEELNRIIGWIPSVTETHMPELLESFAPNLRGVYKCVNFHLGGETWIRWRQLYTLYQVQQISYEDLAAEFAPFYIEQGAKDFEESNRDWRRALHRNELLLAGIRGAAMLQPPAAARSSWIKYRNLTIGRMIFRELGQRAQERLVSGDHRLPEAGPYEYSAEVLARVRCRVERR
jgi:raffinose/stachyose/melibiose transport system substrate-binding protein